MKNIVLSICISVHNTGDLLPRCLDSILKQTYQDYEIVLVNNGSTDNSLEIMADFKKKNCSKIIKVIDQIDKGLAQGRQAGINNAEGEYVTFLDADDYVFPEAYEKMIKNARDSNSDIVEIETEQDGKKISSNITGVVDGHLVLHDYFKHANLPTMLWLRMYKRTLFEKVSFPILYTNNEDNFVLPCLFYYANKISFVNEVLHHYSSDNKRAVMVQYENSKSSKRYLESRIATLHVIEHLETIIGIDNLKKEFCSEYSTFVARLLVNFLFAEINIPKIDDRIDLIICNTRFTNVKSILRFVRKYCPCFGKTYLLIKLLGVRNTYSLLNGGKS